ncbi:UbiA family prenyltransferase [Actinokineospora guangxiensis]|uniref:UbiA family prenyltransferase n=1 Tax=Actinokineospora guangxiensis TaxID=1490288 RepID=A0ABW0ERI4_9PSEU
MQQAVRTGAALLLACHPAPALTVAALAGGLAFALGGSAAVAAGLCAAVFLGQLSVGWLNDLLDADRDAAVGRTDKPVADGRVSRRTTAIGIAVAAPAAVAATALFGPRALIAHSVALISAWAYDLGVKATAFSVVPYTVSFALLPVIAGPAPGWLIVAGALLGSAAHFANALPDIDDDLATGVRGLPHRLGRQATTAVAAVLLVGAGVVVAFGPPGPPPAVALVGVVAGLAALGVGLAVGGRGPFTALLVVALADVVLAAHAL